MNKVKKSIVICSALFSAMVSAGGDLIFASNFEFNSRVAGTSFEEPLIEMGVNDGKYYDTGFHDISHDLINNAGEAPVDLSGTSELDIDARWERYDDLNDYIDPKNVTTIPGMTEGDWAGVTTFTPSGNPFTDGNQGYQFSDPDGTMIIESEPVDLTGKINNEMTLDYFIAQTTWEVDPLHLINDIRTDGIRIYAENMVNNDRYYILDTLTNYDDINDLNIAGIWQNGSIMLPDDVIVRLVIEFRAGSSSEIMWLDNVQFKGQ